ncbi:DUF7916 family protein [Brachyspira pilosicoli]|uniref:DUF7916 family protein n=1 Tax=Brachyspira pilosicoli TaxID=52584 RepID=UPI002666328C|nr:hypothetical protein [Brachyspira pilosicoli]
MGKRIFELALEDVLNMNASLLKDIIKKSEGRSVMAEVCCGHQPLIDSVSNAEAASAFGADFITLNLFDMNKPFIWGLYKENPDSSEQTWLSARLKGLVNEINKNNDNIVKDLKKITGRLIGVNLEPVPEDSNYNTGFRASKENYEKLLKYGFDYVVLTGNPNTGVTIENIAKSAKELKSVCGDKILIIAGKMHGAGGDNVYSMEELDNMVKAGADVVMVGAPSTLPGYTVDFVYEQIKRIHSFGALAKTAIGTSQEGADVNTIREMTLWSKMVGADIVHIGDAAYSGMSLPENIMAMSIALRGIRHTYRRMAYRK